MPTHTAVRLYDEGAEALLQRESYPEHVTLLPSESGRVEPGSRLRIMWGQDMLRDVLDGRYRAVVCGVNDADNSHGIVAQIVNLVTTSQWSESSVTSYAKMFAESVSVHAAHDREPYVLKYDLDGLMVLGLLRPKGRDHFTLPDLARGFKTISKMLAGRTDRLPVCSVSFLGARSNRLTTGEGPEAQTEPSFEGVLRTMYESGFRGDVYAAPPMWNLGHVGVFPSYPFPAGLERMRSGSS
ncbi:MAG: hypothetical protein DHS20C14_12510 [Phycisphaeraceae bacterium]|nr:MAG: hypothetical protein DHS20C14_12510 [Phycisphaeraceae bacterium]